jgi:hypothetical protein
MPNVLFTISLSSTTLGWVSKILLNSLKPGNWCLAYNTDTNYVLSVTKSKKSEHIILSNAYKISKKNTVLKPLWGSAEIKTLSKLPVANLQNLYLRLGLLQDHIPDNTVTLVEGIIERAITENELQEEEENIHVRAENDSLTAQFSHTREEQLLEEKERRLPVCQKSIPAGWKVEASPGNKRMTYRWISTNNKMFSSYAKAREHWKSKGEYASVRPVVQQSGGDDISSSASIRPQDPNSNDLSPGAESQESAVDDISASGASQGSGGDEISASGASQESGVDNLSSSDASQESAVNDISASGMSQGSDGDDISASGASQESGVDDLSSSGMSQESGGDEISASGASQESDGASGDGSANESAEGGRDWKTDPPTVIELKKMTKKQLITVLKSANQPTSGRADELYKRAVRYICPSEEDRAKNTILQRKLAQHQFSNPGPLHQQDEDDGLSEDERKERAAKRLKKNNTN